MIVALTGWLFALGFALFAYQFGWNRRYQKTIILGCLSLGLVLSPFAQSTIVFSESDATPPLAGLEQAFLSIWLLVLLPLLQQRLDCVTVIGSLRHGLVVLAMVVMVVDMVGLWERPAFSEFDSGLMTICLIGMVFFIGLIFCLIMTESGFPWDYPAWFAGLLILVQPTRDSLLSLPLTAYEGSGLLAINYVVGFLLFRVINYLPYSPRT